MKIFFSFHGKPSAPSAVLPHGRPGQQAMQGQPKPFPLTRTYVETGDQRCPLAGIWSQMADGDPTPDEPESTWPALRGLPRWRAFHPYVTIPRYRSV